MPTREEKALLTRLERIAKTAEEAIEYLHTIMEEPEEVEEDDDVVHAEYDSDEKGFVCLVGRKKVCKESVFEAGEIVAHLRDEHGILPDGQGIGGWTARHEKKAVAFLEELESDDEEEDADYTRAELKGMSNAELGEILDEWDIDFKSKATKKTLIKLVLDSQKEEEEEEEPEDDGDETDDEYTADGLSGKTNAELKKILADLGGKFAKKTNKTDLISRILDAQTEEEDEEDEEEEDEEFTPYEMKSKAVKDFAKEHGLEKDEVRLIVDYANEESVSLADAAEEFELVDEEEDEED